MTRPNPDTGLNTVTCRASAQDLKDAFNLVSIALAQLRAVHTDEMEERSAGYVKAAQGNLNTALLRFQGE